MVIAALFVDERPGGCYVGLPGVDVWGESRDARTYPGPHPVIAHPPCGRWCRLAALVEARYPEHRRGEDGGCFEAALAAVRRWGGVLEHPARSDAWPAFGLLPPVPYRWRGPDGHGGHTAEIEQGRYGHQARKATWLYAVAPMLPRLRWGRSGPAQALVSWCGNHTPPRAMVSRLYREEPRPGVTADRRRRLSGRAAAATPPAFRDELLAIARSCTVAAPGGPSDAPAGDGCPEVGPGREGAA